MDKIKLQVLFLTYGDKYKDSFDILNILLKDLEEHCDINTIVIDNKINHFSKNGQHIQIAGNNSEFEFSGWDNGIEFIKYYNNDYDICLFINDSFLTNDYAQNKKLLSIETIKGCLHNNALVGKCDRMDVREQFRNNLYTIDGHDVKLWIRTNLFYMTKEMVNKLNSLVAYTIKDLDKFVSKEYHGRAFLYTANISENLKLQMFAWITKYWHSKIELSEKTWDTWRMKCSTMINEKMLTVNIRNMGYNILDYSEFHYGK